jgi:cobalt-zinc-cadmium efflux system outer membrane protein
MLTKYFAGRKPVQRLCIAMLLAMPVMQADAQNNPDTIRLTLPEAEKQFMERNLFLLASKYNVDANKALIEQAKLWDNPVLVTDQNIYAGNKFFAHGNDANGQVQGQYFIQIQQLIKTAGKRSKWVAMATTNAKLSELQFKEVMRNLKYQLRSDYYNIAQQLGLRSVYNRELLELQTLKTGMQAQLQLGNIAQKDYLRIQALILSMQQDLADNDRQLADTETELKSLLQITDNSCIVPLVNATNTNPGVLKLEAILDTAKQFNAAFAIEETQLLYQQQNLSYQKSMRSPDLTIGPEYDHNSNYAPHYVGLSISLPLNIFNKNQGNIKSAQFAVKQEEATLLQVQQQLNNSIQNAINKLYLTAKLSGQQEQQFYTDYETMFKNITDSYRQRQIGLVEFIDFFDAYRDTKQKNLLQQLNLQLAKEELNYLAGKDVIN